MYTSEATGSNVVDVKAVEPKWLVNGAPNHEPHVSTTRIK